MSATLEERSGVLTVILAAGASSRMGSPKALLKLGDESFLGHLMKVHRSLELPICVVLGEDRAKIQQTVDLDGVTVLVNEAAGAGPLSSIHLALHCGGDFEGLLVHPVDHPLVRGRTLQALIETHADRPEGILLPRFQGRNGHPVLFPRRFFEDLLAAPLEVGARWVVHRHSRAVRPVDVDDPAVLWNINTREDLDEALRRSRIPQ